ncbi:hypothetical protein LAZ67_5003024 [Cordylochernes scorpioides]|uniref:Uncharacterized protein n=1 Tax=Cordylochernes scorpioides TaxID=51811 RepID=A0ABY6KKF5_9ARAC|nr:hypothetical protein LAZ67_5003024 [Cordylochernes scorpioides]
MKATRSEKGHKCLLPILLFKCGKPLTITRGDRSGEYTFISTRVSSVVDYCIVSCGLLGYVHDLYVEELPYSDHLPFTIKMKYVLGRKQVMNLSSISKKETLFAENLGRAYGSWNNSIENIINNMVKQIKNAMLKTVMKIETKTDYPKLNPWFDHDFYTAKKNMKTTLAKYAKSNKDLDRLEYVKTRNKYTSIINIKRKYFCKIQEKINNIYDSTIFWKTIATFRKRNC